MPIESDVAGTEWTVIAVPGPVVISTETKKPITESSVTTATMVKTVPNVRSGPILACSRGNTAQNVVAAEARVEPERAINMARDL